MGSTILSWVHHIYLPIFFIFVLSEDTGRLSGLRGSDNESEEE